MSNLLKRGNKLWESNRMFLPEHKAALLEHEKEMKKVVKPVLDEQELEEIGIVVMNSLNYELDIKVVYWEDGFFNEVIGVVDRVDIQLKRIKLVVEEEVIYISIDCLKTVDRI